MKKNTIIENLESENKKLKKQLDHEEYKNKIQELSHEMKILNKKIISKKNELSFINEISDEMEYNIYNPSLDFIHNNYVEEWNKYKVEITNISKSDKSFILESNLKMGGSESKGVKLQKQLIKLGIKHLNNFSVQQHKKINQLTYERNIEKFTSEFKKINNIFIPLKVSISDFYKNKIIESFSFVLNSKMQIEEEKEKARQEREKIREEKKLEEEIKLKKEKINKDISKYLIRINELEKLAQKLNTKKDKEIYELKSKINELENSEEELESRLAKVGSGYVYIISNIGSLGKNIYKIGVTRRLDPEERIRELSSASVPFKFDKHALIWSTKAFDLEAQLHKRFNHYRVNRVNKRKEFFNITLDEIKAEATKMSNVSIEWIDNPLAIEYRLSLKGDL